MLEPRRDTARRLRGLFASPSTVGPVDAAHRGAAACGCGRVTAVLDASAVLALLLDEPGAKVDAQALDTAVISTVNLAELLSKLADCG